MLSGNEIRKQVKEGNIIIDPFHDHHVGPNSYDFTLSSEYGIVQSNNLNGEINMMKTSEVAIVEMKDQLVFLPGQAHLARSVEKFGSTHVCFNGQYYIPVVHGRSTVARHGLMIHYAGLGDTLWCGHMVLEIVNMTGYPITVKPGVRIGQVSFEPVEGAPGPFYQSTYQNQDGIVPGKALKVEDWYVKEGWK